MSNRRTPRGAGAVPRRPLDREAYERRAREGPCLVCETLAGNPGYRAHLVWADDDAVAFLARDPPLLGTTLVAPRAHREQVTSDFRMEEYLALQRLVYLVGEAVRQELPTERLYLMSLGSQSGNRHVHCTSRRCHPGSRTGSSSSPPCRGSAGWSRCPTTTWRTSAGASALAWSTCTRIGETSHGSPPGGGGVIVDRVP
jgi:diadenosine tetraphosphate (Ap4A) HIT family hydrolase